MIKGLRDKLITIWWDTSGEFLNNGDKISVHDKIHNEKRIETFRKELFKTLQQIPEDELNQRKYKEEILDQIKNMESNLSHYEISLVDFFIENGYGNVTKDFVDEAKSFDPNINVYDIFQAIRNVWIMNSIQILFNMEVKLTPSIFAYSMLYPYSDNYLDDVNISFNEKLEFNHRFRRWLMGNDDDTPINEMEERIYSLVNMISSQFDRNTYPKVHESLLAIHAAQAQSLAQQKEYTMPYEKDILGITFEKGGASVLADAYLVKGNLEQKEAEFMFSYGIFLQIIDDLQDVDEDFNNKHMTILSQLNGKYPLDRLINKLFNFINELFDSENTFTKEKAITLKKVIKDSSYIMIYEAISNNKNRFSKEYLGEIETKSIVRLSYLKKIKKKFEKTFSSEDIIKICQVLSL